MKNSPVMMSFKKSDVFHVVDTLHNGVVGSWQAFRMGEWFILDSRSTVVSRMVYNKHLQI